MVVDVEGSGRGSPLPSRLGLSFVPRSIICQFLTTFEAEADDADLTVNVYLCTHTHTPKAKTNANRTAKKPGLATRAKSTKSACAQKKNRQYGKEEERRKKEEEKTPESKAKHNSLSNR